MKSPVPCAAPAECVLACVAATAIFLTGCSAASGGSGPVKEGAPAPQNTVPVTVATVVQKAVPVLITGVGSAEAVATVSVRSQATGELTSVHFEDGAEVEKGQTLFTLDRRAFEAAV